MGPTISLISFMAAAFGVALGNKHYLFAPQIIREGVDEAVVLSLHGVNAANGAVSVIVASAYLEGIRNFHYENVDSNKPIKMKIRCDKPDGAPETNKRQYVALTVLVNQNNKEIYRTTLKMRVVEDSGHLFVKTNKQLYKPRNLVKITIVALSSRNNPERKRIVEVRIQNPSGNAFVRKRVHMSKDQRSIKYNFRLPKHRVIGTWLVEAIYIKQRVSKWAKHKFNVRQYFPVFNVRVEPDHPFILVKPDMMAEQITGVITAEYSYGKKIDGVYYVTAKLLRPRSQKSVTFYQFPDYGKQARLENGQAKFRIKTTAVLNALDDGGFDLLQDEGATVVIEVSVTSKV